MRLTPGANAPDFVGESLGGRRLALGDLRGQAVWLKCYRFAGCPICNLHLRALVRRHDELRAAGITPIVFFHSPKWRVEEEIQGRLPIELVADPDKRAFSAYGVEASWAGMFAVEVARDYVRAMRAGFFSRPFGHEGGSLGHPADFLIDARGVVQHAHYGKHYADMLGVDQILAIARSTGLVPERAAQEVRHVLQAVSA